MTYVLVFLVGVFVGVAVYDRLTAKRCRHEWHRVDGLIGPGLLVCARCHAVDAETQ